MTKETHGKNLNAVFFGAGLLVTLAIALFTSLNGRNHVDPMDATAAKTMGLENSQFLELRRIIDKAEAKHVVSDTEWKSLAGFYGTSTNSERQSFVLQAMSYLENTPETRAQKTQFAHQFLDKGNPSGNMPAIRLLKKVEDPSWQTYAEKSLQNVDQATRDVYARSLGMKVK